MSGADDEAARGFFCRKIQLLFSPYGDKKRDMIKKISTIAMTLLLLLSVSIVGSDADLTSLEEDVDQEGDTRWERRNESAVSEEREFRDPSLKEFDTKEISEGGIGEKRYEAGVEYSTEDGNGPMGGTRGRKVVKDRQNILQDIYSSREDYDPRGPIRIDGDADLERQAVEEGWDGDGSKENPWVIEDHGIDGGVNGYSLYIGNVTDHFEVKSCYLYNASGRGEEYFRNSGIHLYNTTNGVIKENFVIDNAHTGVYLEGAEGNVLSENTVLSNEGHGILLESSSENEVKDNVVGDKRGYQDIIDGKGYPVLEEEEERYRQDSLLVEVERPHGADPKEQEGTLQDRIDSLAGSVNGKTSRIYESYDMAEIRLEEGVDVKSAVDHLSERDGVVEAEPNYLWDVNKTPDDPGYDSLWAMPKIDAPGAWDLKTGSGEVIVGVIDTGIDYNHLDLKENMWTGDEGSHGYNALNDSYHPKDDHGHGTHVAGTIGAVGDNELGTVGMNWNVSLMGLKFLDSSGTGTTSDAIACLEFVSEKKKEGENVVATSNSWGGSTRSDLLYRAIEKHQEEGISFIAAAGNDGKDNGVNPTYPANYDLANIISVAATDRNDELASFSNHGERTVDVGAPGVDINSTSLDHGYEYMSGTSMAVPHVSGLTALLASKNSSYDQVNLKNVILSTIDYSGDLQDRTLAGGRINASRAVKTSPDDEDIEFWIHRPGSTAIRGDRTSMIASLNDGVDPILNANITVESSTGEETIVLKDDGAGDDQIENDGYYSGGWTPRYAGEVTLTITAESEEEDWEETKAINVEVKGGAGLYVQHSEENTLSGNTVFNEEHGIFLYSSSVNHVADNELRSNYKTGLRLYDSEENDIEDQTVRGGENGLLLERSSDNFVFNNSVSNTEKGIMVGSCEGNFVDNNTASNNGRSIYLQNSRANSLTNNTLSNSDHGIYFYASEDNDGTANTLLKNEIGMYLQSSTAVTLKENRMEENGLFISGHRLEHWNSHSIGPSNSVNEKPVYYWKDEEGKTVPRGAGQVILANCSGVTVEDQNISRGSGGIILGYSEGNRLMENTVSDHDGRSIYLHWSSDNELIGNTASSNTYGIYLSSSDGNEIHENNASNNEDGIYLEDSASTLMTDNTVADNDGNGIWIDGSSNNEIINNHISNNKFRGIDLYRADGNILDDNYLSDHSVGIDIAESADVSMSNNRMVRDSIYMWGEDLEHWDSHTIDTTNTVNGRPVHYWKDEADETVPDGAGQVILVNCTGMTVENQNVSQGTAGILLGFSDGNTLVNNDASKNDKGICLFESDDNEVRENNLSDNTNDWFTLSYGIWLSYSSGTLLTDNEASNNDGDGIYLTYSEDNSLINNDVVDNEWRGIDLRSSDSNTILESYASENRLGIRIQYSLHVAIEDNEVQKGIGLRNSEYAVLVKNTMAEEGVSVWGGRKVYWNTHEIDTSNTIDGEPIYYWRDRTSGTVPEGAGQIILANCTGVLVEKQDLKDGRLAIQVGFSNSNVIERNTLSGYDYAVYLRNSEDNTLTGNSLSDNNYGLRLYRSDQNRVTQNNASENDNPSIDLWASENNTLANNTLWNNQRQGIRVRDSDKNTLVNNRASENSYGIAIYNSFDNVLKGNELSKNHGGVYLSDSADNTIRENTAYENSDSGIELRYSKDNMISDNKASNNSYAVDLEVSDNNTFTSNNISRNEVYGFYISKSLDNVIYHNWFIENEDQAFDDVDNEWDGGDPSRRGEGGNYWSDHEGTDRGDGIVELGYDIRGNKNQDRYPWMDHRMIHPAGSFEVTVEDIRAGETPVLNIYDVEDVYDNPVKGGYEVKVVLENMGIEEGLHLKDNKTEYKLPELTVAGEYTLEVVIDDVVRTENFYVETAELDHFEIEPEESTVTAGEKISFRASAYDEFENMIGDVTQQTDWSIDDEAGGNWTGSVYRSKFAGRWNVTGTYDERMKSKVHLIVEPASVEEVQLEPEEEQTITSGEKIDFSAEAYDGYGNLITDENSEFSWKNTDHRGRFIRTEQGKYSVTARYENVSSEPTSVTVEERDDRPFSFAAFWLALAVFISTVIYERKKKKDRR
ncbi:MAG: NosD domain-containing protein [Candidatus Natronoplasma sp.]